MGANILSDSLNAISQGLLYPVMIILILAIAYSVITIGSVIVEFVVERRHFKVALPELQHAIDKADAKDMGSVVMDSGLLLTQKKALITLFDNRDLMKEARWALAKKLLFSESEKNESVVARNETIAKVAPMFGLMGTLIPLGPGVVALGSGDTQTLSSSLLIAFDTTVAGLVVGAICMIVARIRRYWYEGYSEALEAATTTMLEKIDDMEEKAGGHLVVERPVSQDNSDAESAGKKKRSSKRSSKLSAAEAKQPVASSAEPSFAEAGTTSFPIEG